ncbi:MAG TPA: hypothetical protein VFA90_04290 [Terriglobales bacterium]|nr:hypothetical protein [Terriglobales bacterium]
MALSSFHTADAEDPSPLEPGWFDEGGAEFRGAATSTGNGTEFAPANNSAGTFAADRSAEAASRVPATSGSASPILGLDRSRNGNLLLDLLLTADLVKEAPGSDQRRCSPTEGKAHINNPIAATAATLETREQCDCWLGSDKTA